MSIQAVNSIKPAQAKQQPKKSHFTDNFESRLRNSADMNDCISVPRTIFKGYLGIMFGTMLASAANLIKKSPKIKTAVNVVAIGSSAYGTWAFARPYALKGAVPTVKAEKK